MRRRLTEETVLFVSVLKWFVLATLAGAIVGVSTAVFLKGLSWADTPQAPDELGPLGGAEVEEGAAGGCRGGAREAA